MQFSNRQTLNFSCIYAIRIESCSRNLFALLYQVIRLFNAENVLHSARQGVAFYRGEGDQVPLTL